MAIGGSYIGHHEPATRKLLILDQNGKKVRQKIFVKFNDFQRHRSSLSGGVRTFPDLFQKVQNLYFFKKKFLWSKSTSAIPKIGLIKYSDDLIMLWSNSIQECNSWIHDCILYALSRVFHFFCLHTTWYQIVLAWVGFQRGAILAQTAPTKVKLISEIGITGGSLLLEWLGMGWEITNGSKSLRLNEKQHRIRLRPVGNSSRVSKLIEENPIIR